MTLLLVRPALGIRSPTETAVKIIVRLRVPRSPPAANVLRLTSTENSGPFLGPADLSRASDHREAEPRRCGNPRLHAAFLTEQQSAEQQFAPCRAGAESESGAEQQSATLANIEAGHSSSAGADDQILTEVTTWAGLRRAPVRPPGH